MSAYIDDCTYMDDFWNDIENKQKNTIMNERIKELVNEATSYKEGLIKGKHDIEVFDKEKFAQLLLKECAGIYDKIDNGNTHLGTDDYLEALYKHFRG